MYDPYSSYLYNQSNFPLPYYQQTPNIVYETSYNQRVPVLPPTQPKQLMGSAEHTKNLLADAQIVNETLRTSPSFNQQLTTAAQQSQHQIVHDLINNLPIQGRAIISFSPGGISITFLPKLETNNCCYVVTFLNWKEFF